MSILTYFIPYVFLFLAVIRLRQVGGVWLRVLASVGLLTTIVTLILSAIPAEDDPNKSLTLFKTIGSTVALVAIGVLVYAGSTRRKELPA
jgi:hypothetical protein